MSDFEIRIEMRTEDLTNLQAFLDMRQLADVDVVPIPDISEGYRQEPVTIALAVVAAGAAAVRGLAKALEKWVEQRGKTTRAELHTLQPGMKLTIERDGRRKVVTLSELADTTDD